MKLPDEIISGLHTLGVGGSVFYFTGSWTVAAIIILVAIVTYFLLSIIIDMVKTVYFTLFYTAVTVPEAIPEKEREEVTHYLTSVTSGRVEPLEPQQFVDPKVQQLIPVVQQYRTQGHTDDEITALLTEKGWPEDSVKKAIDMAGKA